MGCTSSAGSKDDLTQRNVGKLKNKHHHKDVNKLDVDELTEADIQHKKEELLQRQEQERDYQENIYAEQSSLRSNAMLMIERKDSCESLMDLLDDTELEEIRRNEDSFTLQKQMKVKYAKEAFNNMQKWVLFNNLDAISEEDMQVLTFFMQKVVSLRLPSESNVKPQAAKPKVAEEEDDPFSGYESDNESDEEDETPRPRRSPPRSPPNTPRERLGSSDKSSLQNPEETALALANGKIKSKPSLSLMVPIPAEFSYVERIAASENFLAKSIDLDNAVNNAVDKSKERLLLLQLSTLAKMESFIISKDNAFDFELPCGIVTIGVAAMVIDLFKSGGRLSYRSVHKLLRLGYKSLRQLPNTTYISVGVDDKLTVVGDIHGQLQDLFHILDSSGMPTVNNKYLFNGDFVDRGPQGVEVMCVLLALHIAMPGSVHMNRGNHEDYAICSAYGFQIECYEKYDEITFGMFCEVFQFLPLFAVINDSVFVVHGGLFQCVDITLQELDQIVRYNYTLQDLPEAGDSVEAVPRSDSVEFMKQVQRGALWSDPIDQYGLHISMRGAGVNFGPDVTAVFLVHNRLNMVVRSHECIRTGFLQPYSGDYSKSLCTIFSASDYGGSGNSAAVMIFTHKKSNFNKQQVEKSNDVEDQNISADIDCLPVESEVDVTRPETTTDSFNLSCSDEVLVPGNSDLKYIVQYFFVQQEMSKNVGDDHFQIDVGSGIEVDNSAHNYLTESSQNSGEPQLKLIYKNYLKYLPDHKSVVIGSSTSVYELVVALKDELSEAFREHDIKNDGLITRTQWVKVMSEVSGLQIRWISLLPLLVSDCHYKVNSKGHMGKRMIDYMAFLDSFNEIRDDDLLRSHSLDAREASSPIAPLPKFTMNSEEKTLDAPLTISNGIEANTSEKTTHDNSSECEVFGVDTDVKETVPPLASSKSNKSAKSSGSARSAISEATANAARNIVADPFETCFQDYLISRDMIDAIYIYHRRLETVFRYFDQGRDGFITLEEFRRAGDWINSTLPENEQIKDFDRIFNIMDVNECNQININVFFEMFRLADVMLDDDILEEISTTHNSLVHLREHSIGWSNHFGKSPVVPISLSGKFSEHYLHQHQFPHSPTHMQTPYHNFHTYNFRDSDAVEINGIAIKVDGDTSSNEGDRYSGDESKLNIDV